MWADKLEVECSWFPLSVFRVMQYFALPFPWHFWCLCPVYLMPNTYLVPFFLMLPLKFSPGDPCSIHLHSALIGLELLSHWFAFKAFWSSCRGKQIDLAVERCTPRQRVPTPCLVSRCQLDLLIFSWPHAVWSQTRSPASIVSIVLSLS